ncbi:MAG: hypothetical protein HGJ94_21845 [Desulfosarcina sp.]|nr:hypothetical protein [Desulfosarcina sp.]MBC2742619.1 hypothetical protein [Desulfosarcina sp.]MBC2765529.1 hypothetical protein [Desulfosarcina sp.]
MDLQQSGRVGAFEGRFFNRFFVFFIFIIISAILLACVGNMTYFKQSREISSTFEKGEVLADHRYYAGGLAYKPNAVIAIHNDYTLESSDSWKEISVNQESLASLIKKVGFVAGAEEKTMRIPNGAKIIAPGNVQIGVWYSVYEYSTVRLLDGNLVAMSAPSSRLPTGVGLSRRGDN